MIFGKEKRSKVVAILDQLQNGLKNCGIAAGGFQAGNHCAGGGSGGGGAKPPASGGGGFRLGGSPGGKESRKDRIEGTQAEANAEVKKYEKAAKQAETKLKAAEARRGVSRETVKSLVTAMQDVTARKTQIAKDLAASQSKIAKLQAQLAAMQKKKSTAAELNRSIDGELATMQKHIGNLKQLTSQILRISKKADSL